MIQSVNASGYKPVRSPRGNAISCKGWQQEAVLRLLLNSVDPDIAEHPEDLTISGAFGKAAANWESFGSLIEAMRNLESDHSLYIEAGRLSPGRRDNGTPFLVTTNDSSDARFGNWLYAGTQTALPVLYEIYAAAARQHYMGDLGGKLALGAGLGGFGGAQPLAATLHGAAFLGIDADPERIKRRVKAGYCEVMVNNLDEALRILKNAVRKKEAASVALIGNAAEIIPSLAQRGVVPDLITDYTPRDQAGDYIPLGFDATSALHDLRSQPDRFDSRQSESLARQMEGVAALEKLGSRVVSLDQYLQPLVEAGLWLTIWLALSGEPADIAVIDRLALQTFSTNGRLQHWLSLVKNNVRFQGLPARVAWLSNVDSTKLVIAANQLVSQREITTPVLFGWHFAIPGANLAAAPPEWALKARPVWSHVRSIGASPNNISAAAILADGTDTMQKALSRYC